MLPDLQSLHFFVFFGYINVSSSILFRTEKRLYAVTNTAYKAVLLKQKQIDCQLLMILQEISEMESC
jgi:hypothetical protein